MDKQIIGILIFVIILIIAAGVVGYAYGYAQGVNYANSFYEDMICMAKTSVFDPNNFRISI